MSKFEDIIDRRIDKKLQAQQTEMHIPVVIESVSDDYLRADVSLLTDRNTIITNRLNKSGEKLTAGQQAWLYYTTLPSSGYIGRTEGEADPMGGGSGAPAARVENAAVLLDSDFHDYLINETLMLDIQMPTALYYGANLSDQQDMARAFVVAQGHYCTYAASTTTSYNASTGVWTVGGAPGLYEAIIANRLKFGNIIGDNLKGGFLTFGMNTSATYPTKYVTVELKFTSCSRSVNTSVNPPVLTTSYQAQLVFTMYNTDAPSGNWWETTMTHSTTPAQTPSTLTVYIYSPTNNSNLTGKVVELMMVPNVYRYFDNDTTRYPYGYVDLGDMYIFAKDESGGWGVYRVNMTSGQQWASRIPLTSEAEKCFLLGLSKKTEPQTS